MKQPILFILLAFCLNITNAQTNSRLSLEINYGLNGNFFVGSYDEQGGPQGKTYFFNKDFIGTIAGIELTYQLNDRSRLGLAYARSINKETINFDGTVSGVDVIIRDFQIRHINNFYQLFYDRSFSRKLPALHYQGGIFYLRMAQQELEIANFMNAVNMDERNYKNSRLEEGGVFAGLHFSKYIDKKFELGIKSRVYFLASTGTFEAVTLTPTLTYHF
ncbi:MAG: hypothetical protein ACXWV0_04840 [Flavisolibacter sp.]